MYSQNEEEKIILNYFKEKGTFIDIGSNDGVTLSNTRALAELGWAGICVEPSPLAYDKLYELYKDSENIYTYPFALGVTNGLVKMWDSGEHLGNGDSGLLSTMTDEDYNKWRNAVDYKEIEVRCFRWKTFLNRVKYKKFDFISIDIEGMEVAVLEQIDLRDTMLVCAEWNSKPEVKAEFDRLMIGFNVIYQSIENLIYAR